MTANPASILDSVKKVLGFDPEYETFDLDITMFINAAFGSLLQLGVGPDTGFWIEDNTTLWADYVTRQDFLGMIKSFVFMSVRLAFDPPATSFGIDAFKNQIAELTWRINVMAESVVATSTNLSHWWLLDGLSDFPVDAETGDFGYDSSTGNIYVNGTQSSDPEWWDLTGLSDFPTDAIVGEFGFDTSTGQVWRKTA